MAHVQKHTKAVTGHMCAHYDRSANNIGNENINPERTKENYNLAPGREISQMEFINQRCSEIKCLQRKDVNVMCSWVVTVPKDLPASDELTFFKSVYDFLNNRYGEKNVISAYVHNDEKQPHMHYAFVPVVLDKKKRIEKLSAKELVNRADLQTFHKDLENHMTMTFGREIGILNETTKEGNKSIEELKRKSAADHLREADQEADKIISSAKNIVTDNVGQAQQHLKDTEQKCAKMLSDAQQEAQGVKDSLKGLRAEYGAKKAYVGTFINQDSIYSGVTTKKSLTGKIKYEMTKEKFDEMITTYMDQIATQKMQNSLENSIENFKKSTMYGVVIDLKKQVASLEKKYKNLEEKNEDISKDLARVNRVFKENPEVEKAFYDTENTLRKQEQEQRQQKRQSRDMGMEF